MRLKSIIILLVILLGLGGYFYVSTRPKPTIETPKVRVWSIDEETLQRIEIRLPQEGKKQAFVRETITNTDNETEAVWYLDDGKKSAIDRNRWGA